MTPKWTKDPDAILDVALAHCLWDPEFADRVVRRIAAWAQEDPRRRRDELRELLKAPRAGMQALAPVEYAAVLARTNDLRARGHTLEDAIAEVAQRKNASPATVKTQYEKAREMFARGELEEWRVVLEKGRRQPE